ncbi:hypothetical protein J5N97_024713 [Dioscorea zingiberensis]|uniref:Pectinesterase inhibitor domain-containing protein n=1 Tax=Dioscorea zingiberensis TaxID=325984 RepID=A0A9D5C700_9LILI|nr:hypothetical protein J5N97_024713 [Dioscorea zingiberensis]
MKTKLPPLTGWGDSMQGVDVDDSQQVRIVNAKGGEVKRQEITSVVDNVELEGHANNAMVSPCKNTLYPFACESTLASTHRAYNTETIKEIFDAFLQYNMSRAQSACSMDYNLSLDYHKLAFGYSTPMDDCLELMDISLELLSDVLNSNNDFDSHSHDIKMWLNITITN